MTHAEMRTEKPGTTTPAERRALLALLCLAFGLRLICRLRYGEANFLENGYGFYREIAQTFIDGGGLCWGANVRCAVRMPVYPMVIAPLLATGWLYPGLVILQAALGTALAWVAWALGRVLFDSRAALVAAAMTALNPYAVVHDTALQDSVLVNLLIASGVWLLLRASRAEPGRGDLLAGLALALAVLTTARVALILPFALLWVLLQNGRPTASSLTRTLLVALPAALLVGGWTVRNWVVVGAPVLTTESGESFWVANNAWTFEYLPNRSIDLAMGRSYESLSEAQQEALSDLDGHEVDADRLLARWGLDYVWAHPWQVTVHAARKVWVAASGQPSPSRPRPESVGYLAIFAPIHLLALVGCWRARRNGPRHLLVPLVLAGFFLTTALYWAHTSHKSVIDAFLIVYAASVVVHGTGIVLARGETGHRGIWGGKQPEPVPQIEGKFCE